VPAHRPAGRLGPELAVSAEDIEVGYAEDGGEVAREPGGDPSDRLRAGGEGAEVHAETASRGAGVVRQHGGVELECARHWVRSPPKPVVIENPNLAVRVDEQFGGEECFSATSSVLCVLCQQQGQPQAVQASCRSGTPIIS
jgi:hypothetical protein